MFNSKHEKLYIILFFSVLTVILTWPAFWHFFSSVPSFGSDTMQVIGVAGEKANLLSDQGFFKGTIELIKRSEFNITALYAYFQLIFGRVAGYNLLFFASFILSGFGAYLLAYYFTKSKPASVIAGIIFAFSPLHFHNSLSTNVGTMHQEWLPFFALYLFRFFDDLRFKNFILASLFLGLIGFTEHQLLAFTLIFVAFFVIYKLIIQPKIFIKGKFLIYAVVSVLILSILFFFMFRSLFNIVSSGDNYLNPGFKAAVKYSNDALSIFVPPPFHSLWPNAFSGIRQTFERRTDSTFSVYVGFSVLLLSLSAVFGIRSLKKERIPVKGIFFWFAAAIGFYVLSLGPYLHYKGVLDPPVKMPYLAIYNYLPFYDNVRTVGRLFVWSMLAFSMLAGWGIAYAMSKVKSQKSKVAIDEDELKNQKNNNRISLFKNIDQKQKIIFFIISAIIILEFLAVPVKTNSLLHSSFYEKLGQDRGSYSILETPGNTDYDFASRDLVWKSIHRKNTVNGYDFARVIEDHYTFQRGTPIIRTLLYDIPEGDDKQNDRDIMKDSYYKISNEILNYYNIRYVILDKEGLKGDPKKNEADQFYAGRAYIQNVLKCKSEYEDEFLFACEIDREVTPRHMFLAMDYSNKHWVGKDKGKDGIRRWAESGAGVKLVNMSQVPQEGKFNFKIKLYKPLSLTVFLNGQEIYKKYLTQLDEKIYIETKIKDIRPGENEIIFEVRAADGSEIRSEKKSDTVTIYDVEVE